MVHTFNTSDCYILDPFRVIWGLCHQTGHSTCNYIYAKQCTCNYIVGYMCTGLGQTQSQCYTNYASCTFTRHKTRSLSHDLTQLAIIITDQSLQAQAYKIQCTCTCKTRTFTAMCWGKGTCAPTTLTKLLY